MEKKKYFIDQIHLQVCGHSTFSDMKTLLHRNGLWDNDTEKYSCDILETCTSCKLTALPKKTRKVSLSSMSRSFNQQVCIDHFYLGENIVFHVMNASTRYSSGCIATDASMDEAVRAFESQWSAPFCHPDTIIANPDFNNDLFRAYVNSCGIKFVSLPPRRHKKCFRIQASHPP